MAYRMVYLCINSRGYSSGWASDTERDAFKSESRRLFQDMEWTLHEGRNGTSDTVTQDRQDLYLHPTSFSGVMDENNIEPLQEHLLTVQTFRRYAVDCYEEYTNLSDEEYCAALESKRDEIIAFILEQCRTKQTNLYIIDPVATHITEHFDRSYDLYHRRYPRRLSAVRDEIFLSPEKNEPG
ncbi:MAG: hypothetical protein K2O45_12665 [Oscillospiraceae bacterium]|nr:hypothetical protein [Oscillospiraceae bacterium]